MALVGKTGEVSDFSKGVFRSFDQLHRFVDPQLPDVFSETEVIKVF